MIRVAIKGKTAGLERLSGSLHRTFPPRIFSKPGEHDLLAEKESHEEVDIFRSAGGCAALHGSRSCAERLRRFARKPDADLGRTRGRRI